MAGLLDAAGRRQGLTPQRLHQIKVRPFPVVSLPYVLML
jgi:hypothetical protein